LTRLVAYQVNPDGHWDPVAFSPENLKVKEVYILVDDSRKEIWIWIGQNADVKTRFISSTAATEIRRLYGLTYRVKTVDQGLEPPIFLDCINSIPINGIVPELKEKKPQIADKKPKRKTKPTKKRAKKGPTKKKLSKTSTKTVKSKAKPKTKSPTVKKAKPKPRLKKGKSEKATDTYLPQDTSVITTPPCPECEIGYLLPYSEVIEQEGREPYILPFAKWICSKCKFSPEKAN
jgi:hypothetical protein